MTRAPTKKRAVRARRRRQARAATTAALRRALEGVRERCDVAKRRESDPVGYVHAYPDPLDKELVGLLAASIAFGKVVTIRQKLEDALIRLGPRLVVTLDDSLLVFSRMHGWVHRVFRGEDIARLLIGARRVQRAHGSLGARFASDLREGGTLREALSRFSGAMRAAGGLGGTPDAASRRGPRHLLPDPNGSGGSKRMLLYLRWMVRPDDGVDLGLWKEVDPRVLLCPVDTHIHKLSRNLGLTTRKDVSWETAEEITRGLSLLDPKDPVKYDFSLCHLGMLQRCPSKRDAARCEGCGVMPVCRHWQGRRPSGKPQKPRVGELEGQRPSNRTVRPSKLGRPKA